MICKKMQEAVFQGKVRLVQSLVQEALEEGLDAGVILEDGLLSAMNQMALEFGSEEIELARVLACSKALKAGVACLEPYLENRGETEGYTVVIGTAGGDLHDMGKHLVAVMFRSAGFRVTDLGVDVSAKQFAAAVSREEHVGFVCISCLLVTSLPVVKEIMQELSRHPRRREFTLMAGGSAVTEAFVRENGGDLYTVSAMEAASRAREIIEEKKKSS